MSEHPFLRPREWTAFQWVYQGGTMVPNGHVLVSENRKSATRLEQMGFLTRVSDKDAGMVSFGDSIGEVYKITEDNIDRYNLATCCVAVARYAAAAGKLVMT